MRAALVSTMVALATLARTAHADDELAEARRREAALDYPGALAIVERVLARGSADPGRYAELHLLAGRLAAGLDQPQVAEGHFARVLALRPDTQLPAGTSPKFTGPFDIARARTLPLRLTVTAIRGLVTIHLDADALGLVAGIQVHVIDAAGTHSDVADRRAMRIVIPPGTSAVEVAAVDATGNRVWVGPAPADSAAASAAGVPRRVVIDGAPTGSARWPVWGAITTVALVTGAAASWRFRVAQNEWDDLQRSGTGEFSALEDLEQRGQRWGWTANIAFGAAAITGILTLTFYVREANRPTATTPIVFSVGPGPGTGLAVTGAF